MSVGGSDLAIFSSTLMGFISWLGGSICASSIRVTPRDQMSALKSYGRSLEVSHMTTSGAILQNKKWVCNKHGGTSGLGVNVNLGTSLQSLMIKSQYNTMCVNLRLDCER